MTRPIRKVVAEGTAWKIIQDFCIENPGPVPVELIAMDRGVTCLVAPLTGCLARLVRKGKRGIIRTHSGIREEGRKRFAIAHELGHWFLHEAESQFFTCTGENMRDYKGSPMEVEANLFASELLMPTFLFRPLAENAEPILQTVKSLATTFNTSLTATAMKLVDLSRHECILVMSKTGEVTWSKQQRNRSGLRIEKGQKLHQEALAYYLKEPGAHAGPERVRDEAWISQNWYGRSVEVTEESWFLDGYDSVVTLLVITDVDGEETEEDMVRHYQRKATAR
jgi:Zn-dependent peptidase ImmA (M78 family)